MRALVVDDDEAIRKLVAVVCRRLGAEPVLAKSGAEALAAIEAASFDVIILDLMMPGVSGYEVVESVKQTRPEQLPRIIVLTAFTRASTEQFPGVCAVMHKPFDLGDMVEKIRHCLQLNG